MLFEGLLLKKFLLFISLIKEELNVLARMEDGYGVPNPSINSLLQCIGLLSVFESTNELVMPPFGLGILQELSKLLKQTKLYAIFYIAKDYNCLVYFIENF